MRLVTLFLIAAFAASTVDAASYQKTDGTIVDPILNATVGGIHDYSGKNLGPDANLRKANLGLADLEDANLSHADLTRANLSHANLTRASLPYADLTGAWMRYANLTGADLTNAYLYCANLYGAILTNVNLSGSDLSGVYGSYWSTAHWTDAYYYTDSEPHWAYGMNPVALGIVWIDPTSGDINSDGVFDAADYTLWQDNGGDQINYRTWKDHFGQSIASGSEVDPVPEPTTLLLALLALTAAPLRVRCG